MLIRHGKPLLNDEFCYRDIRIEGDRITEIMPYDTSVPREGEEVMDIFGSVITPGMIDLEVHGALGRDFSDGDREGFEVISKALLREGVTGYLAAVNAFPQDVLEDTYEALGDWMDSPAEGTARMLGVHMRGPFVAAEAAGCQEAAYLRAPDIALFRKLNELCGKRVKLMTVSPELPGINDFIHEAAQDCLVSLGNTRADFDTARMAYAYGARAITDPFHNTGTFSPQEPGVIGAAMDVVEALLVNYTDEVSIHPAALRMLFRGNLRRACLISAQTAFTGLPNGAYEIEDHHVEKSQTKAVFENGQDAGSVVGMDLVCKQVMSLGGIPIPLVYRAVTETPAKLLGLFDDVGSIEVGKRADLVIRDMHGYEIEHVILGGKKVV